jgi:D-serine deaminase-like pyridoxal phosphate-dependent protein
MFQWYSISNEEEVDSPALLIFPEIIRKNISLAKELAGGCSVLRPHVKTHKIAEVTQMFFEAGISKFKCATIAEAEMLAVAGAKDVLLAYQPVKSKAKRLLELSKKFRQTAFSCLIDNEDSAKNMSQVFKDEKMKVYIDLNIGMNRTGIKPHFALPLFRSCEGLFNIEITGLHAYDVYTRYQCLCP